MSTPFTVAVTPKAEEGGAVAAAVTSLPATFGPAPAASAANGSSRDPADVAVIAGEAGWTTEAVQAVYAGARGIVVVNPIPEATSELAAAADAAHAAVVLDLRWASNPALFAEGGGPDGREAVRSALGTAAMLDSVATAASGSDPRRVLAEHLAALLAVTGQLYSVAVLRSGEAGYTATGVLANDAPFTAQGVLTSARTAGVDIRLYTADGGVSIQVPDPDTARPADVRVTGPHGELLLPTLYESAHRAVWRRLKDHLHAGTRPDDLAGFARLTNLYATLAAT